MAEQHASDRQTTEQLFLPHHIKIMKVALALAILRQKPPQVLSREFTERLALQFSDLQTNWKSKAEQLERELLRTRQNLIKFQIHSEISTSSSNLFPRDPLNTKFVPAPPITTAGAKFNFNPSNTSSSGVINPLCSHYQQHQQQPRLPLSQLQVGNVFSSTHTQTVEFSSASQDSDSEWQSSGYCSSFPVQKENHSKRLVLSAGSVEQERGGKSDELVKMIEGSTDSSAEEIDLDGEDDREVSATGDQKEDGGSACGEDVGGGGLQERISAHIQFCTSVTSLANASHHLSTLVAADLRETQLTSLANGSHRLSTLVAADLRETLHDTISDALKTLTDCFEHSKHHFTSSLPLSRKALDEAMTSLVDSIQSPLMSVFKDEMVSACVSLAQAIIHKALQPSTSLETVETLSCMVVILCRIPKACQCSVEVLVQQVIKSAKQLQDALTDCSFLTAESIEVAAVQFKLLDTLLTTYEISTIISSDKRHELIENLEGSTVDISQSFPLFLYSVWKIISYLS